MSPPFQHLWVDVMTILLDGIQYVSKEFYEQRNLTELFNPLTRMYV